MWCLVPGIIYLVICTAQVIIFGDACILHAPVENWPMCDCLIAFYSTGFPSDKANAYVKLRRPYALNNLEVQDVLHDRRRVSSHCL